MAHLTESRFFRGLFDADRAETPGDRLFFRLFELFVALGGTYLACSWGLYILRISDVVLPLGIAQYIDVSFMFEHYLSIVNALLISLLLLVGFLRWWRFAYAAAFTLLHLQFAARYSLGEIPHSPNMLGMTLLGLSLAVVLYRDDDQRRRFTLGFTYFFVGLGYTLAGISKLIGTGITWPDGRHLWLWIYEKSIDKYAKFGTLELNGLQEMALDSHLIATAFLTVALLTELASFLVWWRPFRFPVMFAVLGLHIGIYFVMNLIFSLSLIELALLAFPWPALFNTLSARFAWMSIVVKKGAA